MPLSDAAAIRDSSGVSPWMFGIAFMHRLPQIESVSVREIRRRQQLRGNSARSKRARNTTCVGSRKQGSFANYFLTRMNYFSPA